MFYRGLLVALLSVGCSNSTIPWEKNPSRDYPIWIGEGFSDRQRQDLTNSVRTWEYSLNGFLTFSFVSDEEKGLIRWEASTTSKLEERAPLAPNLTRLGWCHHQGVGSKLTVATDIGESDFQWVALHELGHAFGLSHSGKDTLMCDRNSCGSPRITETDINQFHQVWGSSSEGHSH
jgi:hypothetical protein